MIGIDVKREEIGNDVFDDSQIKSYYLTFSDEEYEKLMDFSTLLLDQMTMNKDRYVEASLKVDDVEFPSIGVRFKGDHSVWNCFDFGNPERKVLVQSIWGDVDVCQRFSLKIDLDRFGDNRRLDGLKKINLHSMSSDPSKLRERLGYSLFRDMDIVAPRMAHARVYINGEYHGLFAVVEQIDGRFTANRFLESGDGNLYKEVWPSEFESNADVKKALKTNDDEDIMDVSDFIDFQADVLSSDETNFESNMAPYLDFDYLARYFVVDRAINNFDGPLLFWLPGEYRPINHNYYWYHNSEDGKFVLIPWDLDKSLWYPEPLFWTNNAPFEDFDVPNWNVVSSSCDYHVTTFDFRFGSWAVLPVDCDLFVKNLRSVIYDRQQAIASEFIAGPFSQESVGQKIQLWRDQIKDAIDEDPLVDSTKWSDAVDELLTNMPNYQENLTLMMSGIINEE
ncbi:MAG: CotH kinase family protein [Deltaproteobacteria bacterium]|nr:CotH kinase family protein [Deltaproteobacteria bacterium]